MTKISLSEARPDLSAQWHLTLNGDLLPSDVVLRSKKKIWWKCSAVPGHEWVASPDLRVQFDFGCAICSGRQLQQGFNDLATTHPELVKYWHPSLNLPVTPEQVRSTTPSKAFWFCDKDSTHIWDASIANRARLGRGCPICANVKIIPGVNDFASAFPKLAGEWHPTLNGNLLPAHMSPRSKRSVWWLGKCGHIWKTQIAKRAIGRGCLVCTNQAVLSGFNDLASEFPEIAKTWDPKKNEIRLPQSVISRSNKKYWWNCDLRHSYLASPASRVSGTGCPYCANVSALEGFNDLRTLHPKLAELWDIDANLPLRPEDVIGASGKSFFWKCEEGHPFRKTAYALTKSGCPVCSNYLVIVGVNDLATTNPELLGEWDFSKNGALLPTKIPPGTHKLAWWVCEAGHTWRAMVVSRTRAHRTGCPGCAKYGFDERKPAILYFIEHLDFSARKIGITNSDNRGDRIARFGSRGWGVVYKVEDPDGQKIRLMEKAILQWLRVDQQLPAILGKADMFGAGGSSETFSSGGISNLEIIRTIELLNSELGTLTTVD